MKSGLKVAIVHYWLVNMRGGEKVVEALCEIFPEADIFTHVYDPAAVSETIRSRRVFTTFIQKLPRATRLYQLYLPLMPLALEQLDLRGYDLIISSESGPAKGVLVSPDALHVCYCHTPMRYVWDMYQDYLKTAGMVKRFLMRPVVHYLRLWDLATAGRVDYFIANSAHVAKRIRRHYNRASVVIHPPVDAEAFVTCERGACEDFYLMVGQLVSYKRCDLAVEAFNRMGKRLVIIGEGEQLSRLRKMAGPTISLRGRQPFAVIRDHYLRCRALIFPAEEDFGIVPVEAQMAGRPVIAFRKGGATETVVENETGLFFDRQEPEAAAEAVERFERAEAGFSREAIRRRAMRFETRAFREAFAAFLREKGLA